MAPVTHLVQSDHPRECQRAHWHFYFISGFAQRCVSEANNPSNTLCHCRRRAAICSCHELGLDWPPTKRFQETARLKRALLLPIVSHTWDIQGHHVTEPFAKLSTFLQMWAWCGRSGADTTDDAALSRPSTKGGASITLGQRHVWATAGMKTWASALAFRADQEANEAEHLSLIFWLLQYSAEFVPDLAHLMIKRMRVVAQGWGENRRTALLAAACGGIWWSGLWD